MALIVLCTVLLIGLVGLFVFTSTLTVSAEYRHEMDQDSGSIRIVGLYGLVRWQKKLHGLDVKQTKAGPKVSAKTAEGESNQKREHSATLHDLNTLMHESEKLRRFFHQAKPILSSVCRHLRVESFTFSAVIGTGEAVSTGVLCGSAWTMLSTVLGFLFSRVHLAETPKVSVLPNYQRATWKVETSCILQIGFGHAMLAAFQLKGLWRRRNQHGTSHSRVNAYRHVEYP